MSDKKNVKHIKTLTSLTSDELDTSVNNFIESLDLKETAIILYYSFQSPSWVCAISYTELV